MKPKKENGVRKQKQLEAIDIIQRNFIIAIMEEFLKGKKISVLGDSISSYSGISDNSAYNRTLCSNPSYYPTHALELGDAYWTRLIDRFGLTLCVNNSWSGGFMTRRIPYVGTDPSAVLSPGVERIRYLSDNDGNRPDIIVVFIGLNDLGSLVPSEEFTETYREALGVVKELYPQAHVFCAGMPNRCAAMKSAAEAYNRGIVSAVTDAGKNFHYVDLFNNIPSGKDYASDSIDGLHPSASGMKAIADAFADEFMKLKKQ